MDQLNGLQGIMRKEITSKTFLHITPDKMRFSPTVAKPDVFGEAVATAFTSAKFDISEAGLCLALARSTAAV